MRPTARERAILASLRDVLPDYCYPARIEWLTPSPAPPAVSGPIGNWSRYRCEHVPSGTSHHATTRRSSPNSWLTCSEYRRSACSTSLSSLSGDSLSAVRSIVAIEQRHRLSIPVSTLSTGPAVATLAVRVRDRVAVAFDPCVPIKPTGSRPPLFLVHPIGGNVLCYVELSEHLPPEQPLYGLQASGIEPGSEASQSISKIRAAMSKRSAASNRTGHITSEVGHWVA